MSKAEKSWYIALIILILFVITLRISDYLNGAPFKFEDFLDFIVYIAVLFFPIFNIHSVKNKIIQLKKELNTQGEYTFEELFQLKLEKEYQDKKSRNLRTELNFHSKGFARLSWDSVSVPDAGRYQTE